MEDFVPYELAVKLNEAGFNYDTKEVYEINVLLERYFEIPKPTISQVLTWLFDEKQLFINVDCNICDHFGLYFKVYKKGKETWEECAIGDDYFYHPTEAIFAGIKYVLDNLI